MPKLNSPPMPVHYEPFCSLSHVSCHRTRHPSLTGGTEGAAALSVPTRECFQSSGWMAPPTSSTSPSCSSSSISASTNATPSAPRHGRTDSTTEEVESVRVRSGFCAAGHDRNYGNSAFSTSKQLPGPRPTLRRCHKATTQATTRTARRSWQARASMGQSHGGSRRRRSNSNNGNNCHCNENISGSSNARTTRGRRMGSPRG